MYFQEQKEEISLSPMTKSSIPTEILKKQSDNTHTPPKTSITQGLWRTVSWSNGSYQTGVVRNLSDIRMILPCSIRLR